MNRKFFQLRTMTRHLDQYFQEDKIIYMKLLQKKYKSDKQQLEDDKQLLYDWDQYRAKKFQYILHTTLEDSCFKICLCDFLYNKKTQQRRKTTMEFWIKVAYDIFQDEESGKEVRKKFWRQMRQKSSRLQDFLQARKWPKEWKYLQHENCLNIELLKLYEQYMPIRAFIAQYLNIYTTIKCDIRRMPILKEERILKLEAQVNNWFPQFNLCGSQILEQLSQSDNLFCDQLTDFILRMKPIMFPILKFFKLNKRKGRTINLHGQQHNFILEVLYSLKACCGQVINHTQGSLRLKKNYKCANSYKINEGQCTVMLTTMSQNDINQESIKDIQENTNQGYSAFASPQDYQIQERKRRLVFILSEQKLDFKYAKVDVLYYQLPDDEIRGLLQDIDYQFLVYYSNILFDKCMIVQQNCSSRKPFYQIMTFMWTYVLALYFSEDITGQQYIDKQSIKTNIESNNIQNEDDDIEINITLTQEEIEDQQEIFQSQEEEEEECLIVDQPKKIVKT